MIISLDVEKAFDAGEMAQCLRTQTTLPKVLSSNPSNHMVADCFDVLLDSVCPNFIEDFGINIHEGNWSEVLFLCGVFVWFRYKSNCGFIEGIR